MSASFRVGDRVRFTCTLNDEHPANLEGEVIGVDQQPEGEIYNVRVRNGWRTGTAADLEHIEAAAPSNTEPEPTPTT